MHIHVSNISKKFGERVIFRNVNFSIFSDEVVGIIGDNGIGKTTLLKLLCGLIYPDLGEIFFDNLEIRKTKTILMRQMGVFFEGARAIYWRLSAWQNLIYFSGLKGIFGNAAKQGAQYYLETFDLWQYRNERVETFSLGMKTRLALACSLCHDPAIFLLDEPTSGLDDRSLKIFEEFVKRAKDYGKIVVLSSHNGGVINRISTRKISIKNSQVLNVS